MKKYTTVRWAGVFMSVGERERGKESGDRKPEIVHERQRERDERERERV